MASPSESPRACVRLQNTADMIKIEIQVSEKEWALSKITSVNESNRHVLA